MERLRGRGIGAVLFCLWAIAEGAVEVFSVTMPAPWILPLVLLVSGILMLLGI